MGATAKKASSSNSSSTASASARPSSPPQFRRFSREYASSSRSRVDTPTKLDTLQHELSLKKLPTFPEGAFRAFLADDKEYTPDEFCQEIEKRFATSSEPDWQNKEINDWTPLHILIKTGMVDFLNVFIKKYNPDLTAKLNSYNALQHIACTEELNQKDIAPVIKLLVNKQNPRKGIPINSENGSCAPLIIASYYGQDHIVDGLLANGADVNQIDSDTGLAPLHLTSLSDSTEKAFDLISSAKNIKLAQVDSTHKRTALHFAALETAPNICDKLIRLSYSSSLSPDSRDTYGWTAADYAYDVLQKNKYPDMSKAKKMVANRVKMTNAACMF
jgi:ankyrin repeat protein